MPTNCSHLGSAIASPTARREQTITILAIGLVRLAKASSAAMTASSPATAYSTGAAANRENLFKSPATGLEFSGETRLSGVVG